MIDHLIRVQLVYLLDQSQLRQSQAWAVRPNLLQLHLEYGEGPDAPIGGAI